MATSDPGHGPSTIVAIPARDEASRIRSCLEAFAGQVDPSAFGVLLLLNNVADDTAAMVGALRAGLPFPLRVVEHTLPPEAANAGMARRLAMDAAAAWLDQAGRLAGRILTTDADSRVAADWVARHGAAFAAGADAVAGYVLNDPDEFDQLPPALRRHQEQEARYALLLAEMEARFDPDPADAWPRHGMAAGANLGVSLEWYRRIGGLPRRACGEDRALVATLLAHGARVRHCPNTKVVTSCRLIGRARGGMADTLSARLADPDTACDDALEPAADALFRFANRRRLRLWQATGRTALIAAWAAGGADLSVEIAESLATIASFGELWALLEMHSPRLQRGPVAPGTLAREIARAGRVVAVLRRRAGPARRDDSGAGAAPGRDAAIPLSAP